MRIGDIVFFILLVFSLIYGCWRMDRAKGGHPILDAAALMVLLAMGIMLYVAMWN